MGNTLDTLFDRADSFDDERAPGETSCKYCRAFPLEWVEVRTHPGNRKAWRLVDERGDFHACPAMAPAEPSVDDFEDLTGADSGRA